MKILVLGSGLMGPAAAYNAMSDPEAELVTLADLNQAKLDEAIAHLAGHPGGEKLSVMRLDLSDHEAAMELFSRYDAILAALPWSASMMAFRAALSVKTPIVDLAIPDEEERRELHDMAATAGSLILLGCGLEPGLTEIFARELAHDLDRVEELHIKCGGIPAVPTGPLGYKIVFGGSRLPLRDIPALVVEEGAAKMAVRYSGVEPVTIGGVGECEAWHEGMMPWLLDMPEFKDITEGSQKTIRWPGYAMKASVLLDLGMLGTLPVDVDGTSVVPKHVVDSVLYPHVKLEKGEEDITLFRVDVIGEKNGERLMIRADMVDRYDPVLDFTSMARTTAFTGAIAARMIARGEIQATGLHTSENLIAGPLFHRMVEELAAAGINFDISTQPLS